MENTNTNAKLSRFRRYALHGIATAVDVLVFAATLFYRPGWVGGLLSVAFLLAMFPAQSYVEFWLQHGRRPTSWNEFI
jgi:hypothetical protein